MSRPSVVHNTFVLERHYAAPPERVFAAFADPELKRRWFAEGSAVADLEEFEMEFGVGGREHVRSRFKPGSPFPGVELVAEGTHLDIVAGSRIVTASTMSAGGRRFSASLVTAEILASGAGGGGGTTLILTHQAAFFEGADGPQLREAGWVALLDRLGAALAG